MTFRPPPIDDGSSKHHYLAKYYIKHFTDEDGLLWWYDKKRDEFCRTPAKRKSPNQVFYTSDGNTSYWGEQRNTIAESTFALLDSYMALHYDAISNEPDVQNGIMPQQYAYLDLQLIIQFLRVPANDRLYQILAAQIEGLGVAPEHEHLLNPFALQDETWRKVSRGFLPVEIIRQILAQAEGESMCKMYHLSTKPILVLTDNPVVYLNEPKTWMGFLNPCLMAINKKRLYLRDIPGHPVGDAINKMLAYNVLSIDQARRTIAAPRKNLCKRQ